MCGLSGFARIKKDSGPPRSVHDIFVNLFITSQLRGFDSSGIACLWRQSAKPGKKNAALRGWYVSKDLISPYDIYCRALREIVQRRTKDKLKEVYENPILWAAIGHCRASTIGTTNAANAHPFSFDNHKFVGTHNGTITNAEKVYATLCEKETPISGTRPAGKAYESLTTDVTDSEIILYCIYRWGIEKVYPLIEGAWAFVWWSEDTRRLTFIRNYARPLHYMWSYNKDSLFWSSEELMLKFAIDRADPKSSEWQDHHEEFKPNNLYTVDILKPEEMKFGDKEFRWASVEDLSSLRVKPVAAYNYGHTHHSYSETDSWGDDGFGVMNLFRKNKPTEYATMHPKPAIIYRKEDNIIHLKYSFKQKKPIPMDEWNKEMAEMAGEVGDTEPPTFSAHPKHNHNDDSTCIYCGMDITPENDVESLKIKGSGVVCGDCASNKKTVEEIIEAYPDAGEDSVWIRRWYELEEAEQMQGA